MIPRVPPRRPRARARAIGRHCDAMRCDCGGSLSRGKVVKRECDERKVACTVETVAMLVLSWQTRTATRRRRGRWTLGRENFCCRLEAGVAGVVSPVSVSVLRGKLPSKVAPVIRRNCTAVLYGIYRTSLSLIVDPSTKEDLCPLLVWALALATSIYVSHFQRVLSV